MLRTRILTAAVLACILLAGLFLLSPPWAVLAFGMATTGARLPMRVQIKRALPAANRPAPGIHSQVKEGGLPSNRSKRPAARIPRPTIAAISPNFRMQ